ncbi:hypothetical protein SAY87_030129 [Trapa incisa]|uniref:Uncharacterized protein n=1 Tax=Trapa incisa TaxID=236973 RepID=A0AAN7QE10_9MYRT|nr:hypothetical protein SAY87_030129 [Trapa incisa]
MGKRRMNSFLLGMESDYHPKSPPKLTETRMVELGKKVEPLERTQALLKYGTESIHGGLTECQPDLHPAFLLTAIRKRSPSCSHRELPRPRHRAGSGIVVFPCRGHVEPLVQQDGLGPPLSTMGRSDSWMPLISLTSPPSSSSLQMELHFFMN